jgi:hypothetical protein
MCRGVAVQGEAYNGLEGPMKMEDAHAGALREFI